jgi:Undecaprenyl-phosphate galactose phosphotransferase WbaP
MMPLLLSLPYFLSIWWLPVIFLSFILYERLYVKKLPFWDETRELLKAVSIATITILAVITLGKMTDQISRLTILILWALSLIVFPICRLIGKRILYNFGIGKEKVIIIGAGSAGIAAAKGITSELHLGYHLIGFLDDDDEKIDRDIEIYGTRYKVLGKTKQFRKFISRLHIPTIIIAIPSLPVERLTELTNTIQRSVKNILLIPDLKGIALTNTELYHLFTQELFLLRIRNNLKSPYNRFVKRSFDMMVSLLLLPVLAPLISILGLIIKLDSPGPIFYSQTRIGRGGGSFGIYKFRSMYRDSKARLEHILRTDRHAKQEWESTFKLKNDPRITRVGAFLRRTSLDELPQILNVLKGEMSLVGPRPVVEEEITRYYKEYADYYRLVRPGITGLWQVSGRNDIDYDVRVRLDSWYVLNWSVWLDLLMLVKTVRVVLKKEGAY